MKFKKIGSFASIFAIVVSASIIFSSCTCKITEEQLAKLAEMRQTEKSVSSEIAAQQSAKAKVDNELQVRTSEANDCNGRREIVKQRLSAWPNVWPDYNPNAPVEVAP
jgi:serine protease inhibitor ecotin